MSDELKIPSKMFNTTLPSGIEVKFREQNGDDDEILSLIRNNEDGSSIPRFINAILKSDNPTTNKPWTYQEIEQWRTNDQLYLLLYSRAMSLGEEMDVVFTCPHCETPDQKFKEDLRGYFYDYKKPIPKVGEPGYNKYACPTYLDNGRKREVTLSSGKLIRYKYKTGALDTKTLEIDEKDISSNTPLRLRELSIKQGEQWMVVQVFNIFSGKEMKEIRQDIALYDPTFEAVSEYKCQNPKCKKVHKLSLIVQPDFFFPGATL